MLIYRALQLTIVAGFAIAAAFILFTLALVVAFIGAVDPHSTMHAELSKLATGVQSTHRAIKRILATEI